jgi:hypothetical protein
VTESGFGSARGQRPMPGSPDECRMYAAKCVELAETAETSRLKPDLLRMAEMWLNAATELESLAALIAARRADPENTGP